MQYHWNTGATSQTIVVGIQGTFAVTVTGVNGCTGTANMTVNVYPNPHPIIVGNGFICYGHSTTFDAGIYSHYLWNTGDTSRTITIDSANTYSVTVTDMNGCTGTFARNLFILSLPSPVITPSGPTTFCQGDSVTLNAGNYYVYLWNTNEAVF